MLDVEHGGYLPVIASMVAWQHQFPVVGVRQASNSSIGMRTVFGRQPEEFEADVVDENVAGAQVPDPRS